MVVLPLVKPINSIKEISKNITKENESYFSFKTNSLKNPLINIYNNDNFIFEAREKIEIPEIIINDSDAVGIIPVLKLKDEEGNNVSIHEGNFSPKSTGNYHLKIEAVNGSGISISSDVVLIVTDNQKPIILAIPKIEIDETEDLIIPNVTVIDFQETTVEVGFYKDNILIPYEEINGRKTVTNTKFQGPGKYVLKYKATELSGKGLVSEELIVDVFIKAYGLINSFESEEDLKKVTVVEGLTPTTINRTTNYATEGYYSLEVYMRKAVSDTPNWPHIGFDISAYSDLSVFKTFNIDVFNASEVDMQISLTLIDAYGKKQDSPMATIKKGKKESIVFDLQYFSNLNLSKVRTLYIWQHSFTDCDRHFYYDNIRFSKTFQKPDVIGNKNFDTPNQVNRIQGSIGAFENIIIEHNTNENFTKDNSLGSLKVTFKNEYILDGNYIYLYSTNALEKDKYFDFENISGYEEIRYYVYNPNSFEIKIQTRITANDYKIYDEGYQVVEPNSWKLITLNLKTAEATLNLSNFRYIQIYATAVETDVLTFYVDDFGIYLSK